MTLAVWFWPAERSDRHAPRFGWVIAAAMVAACTTAPLEMRPDSGTAAERSTMEASFSIEGRVSVVYGSDSLAGKIAWNHRPARDEISLASPLGNQLALIVRDDTGVVLTDSRQQQFRAIDVEALTEQQLGWRLPLAGLTDWVRARATAAGVSRRDAAGRLMNLSEAGWEIEFSYESDAARQPRRLVMRYTGAERPLEIRLVIDSQAPASPGS